MFRDEEPVHYVQDEEPGEKESAAYCVPNTEGASDTERDCSVLLAMKR